jgi:hypothetical protein
VVARAKGPKKKRRKVSFPSSREEDGYKLIEEFTSADSLVPTQVTPSLQERMTLSPTDLLRISFAGLSGFTANALVDNGALGVNDNLVSPEIANTLLTLNLATLTSTPTQVCDFNNECEVLGNSLEFSLCFQDKRKDKVHIIKISALIGKKHGIADVILGREAIKAYKLVKRAPSHFKTVSQ